MKKDLRVSFPAPCKEQWDDMSPRQCGRFCDRCDKIIHDLTELTVGDVDALLMSGSEICVRAQVGSDGVVKLKSDGTRSSRRMVTAIAASAGLLAMGGPAIASEKDSWGAIKGMADETCRGLVEATAADGRTYTATIGRNGRYKVKRLPAGSYEVRFHSYCGGEPWSGGRVVVEAQKTTTLDSPNPHGSIIIGMLKVEDNHG